MENKTLKELQKEFKRETRLFSFWEKIGNLSKKVNDYASNELGKGVKRQSKILKGMVDYVPDSDFKNEVTKFIDNSMEEAGL